MRHPEAILLPVLMLTDYYLTLYGSILRNRRYGEHFRWEHYELNPMWQSSVARVQWVNKTHLFLVFFVAVALVPALQLFPEDEEFQYSVQLLLGWMFTLYLVVIGNHVSNILIFRYVIKHPECVSGQVTMAHTLVLKASSWLKIVVLLPLIPMLMVTRSPYVLGGVVSVAFLMILHAGWLMQHRRQLKRQNKQGANGQQPPGNESGADAE